MNASWRRRSDPATAAALSASWGASGLAYGCAEIAAVLNVNDVTHLPTRHPDIPIRITFDDIVFVDIGGQELLVDSDAGSYVAAVDELIRWGERNGFSPGTFRDWEIRQGSAGVDRLGKLLVAMSHLLFHETTVRNVFERHREDMLEEYDAASDLAKELMLARYLAVFVGAWCRQAWVSVSQQAGLAARVATGHAGSARFEQLRADYGSDLREAQSRSVGRFRRALIHVRYVGMVAKSFVSLLRNG